jgi:hypothetical protein
MAYSIDIDSALEKDLTKYININSNLSTKELLLAYLRITQEYNNFKDEASRISQKLPEPE